MNYSLFFSTFITIFIAELGDKTQFAAVAASAQSKSIKEVLLAVVLALSLAGALGVFAGQILAQWLDPAWMKRISGAAFIAVGLWVLLSSPRG